MAMECVQSRVMKKFYTRTFHSKPISVDLVHSYYELWAWISFLKVGCIVFLGFYLLFTILRPFGTRESIRRKVDHGGQIVL